MNLFCCGIANHLAVPCRFFCKEEDEIGIYGQNSQEIPVLAGAIATMGSMFSFRLVLVLY